MHSVRHPNLQPGTLTGSGTFEEPVWSSLHNVLRDAVNMHGLRLGFKQNKIDPLVMASVPSPYSAWGAVKVHRGSQDKVASICTVIGFRPGDGTGNGELDISKYALKYASVYSDNELPQTKTGTALEVALALGTLDYSNGIPIFHPGVASSVNSNYLTSHEKGSIEIERLPLFTQRAFTENPESTVHFQSAIAETVGPTKKFSNSNFNKQFPRAEYGDPHAVHVPMSDSQTIQFVGFLSFFSDKYPEYERAREIARKGYMISMPSGITQKLLNPDRR